VKNTSPNSSAARTLGACTITLTEVKNAFAQTVVVESCTLERRIPTPLCPRPYIPSMSYQNKRVPKSAP